jgi:mannose-6-phosphate isomerase-like protein (cupin superfamily)
MANYEEKRPWGEFQNILEEDYTKVKKITISPEQRPSYQYHEKRGEVWVIVQGLGEVTLEDETFKVGYGDIIQVKQGDKHRIKNIKQDQDLVFIEIQLGEYFGEDDITRIFDDYQR